MHRQGVHRGVSVAVTLALTVLLTRLSIFAEDVPRTTEGRIDLEGSWLNSTATPLGRPKALADKRYFTDEEAAQYEAHDILDRAAAAVGGDPFELEVATRSSTRSGEHALLRVTIG